MKRTSTAFFAFLVCGSAPYARTVYACSGSPCYPATVFPEGGNIPRNQLRWHYTPNLDYRHDSFAPTPSGLHAYVTKGASRTEIALGSETIADDPRTFVMFPKTELEPGAQLSLEDDTLSCDASASRLRATFTVTAEASLPDTLGTLEASVQRGALQVATIAGSCSVDIDAAYADISLTLSKTAQPLAAVIRYRLLLDGSPVQAFTDSLSGATALPPGHARVYTACKPDPMLIGSVPPGMHRARLQGTLPDGSSVDSADVQFELDCTKTTGAPADQDAGEADGGATTPSQPPDSGVQVPAQAAAGSGTQAPDQAAAGSGVQAPSHSPADATTAPNSDNNAATGCSATAPRPESTGSLHWFLALGSVVTRRGSRRGRRDSRE